MSEAKKVAIGVVGGILGIAALFSLVLMIVGKGEEFRQAERAAMQHKRGLWGTVKQAPP